MNKINIFYEHIFGACTQCKDDITIEEMLKNATAAGITGLECDLRRLGTTTETKALFDCCGMNVASIYSSYDFAHDSKDISLKKIRNHLETAAYFGADKVLAIPGFIEENEDRQAVVEKICMGLDIMCSLAVEYGITVTLEDYDDINAPYCTTEGLLYFMKNVSGLKYTFDTGNFAYCLEDAKSAYEQLREYTVHVHLKDRSFDESRANENKSNGTANLSGRVMYPCEVGGGYIGIEKLVKQLLTDGYNGSFSIEHFGSVDQAADMKRSAENIRKWIDS